MTVASHWWPANRGGRTMVHWVSQSTKATGSGVRAERPPVGSGSLRRPWGESQTRRWKELEARGVRYKVCIYVTKTEGAARPSRGAGGWVARLPPAGTL